MATIDDLWNQTVQGWQEFYKDYLGRYLNPQLPHITYDPTKVGQDLDTALQYWSNTFGDRSQGVTALYNLLTQVRPYQGQDVLARLNQQLGDAGKGLYAYASLFNTRLPYYEMLKAFPTGALLNYARQDPYFENTLYQFVWRAYMQGGLPEADWQRFSALSPDERYRVYEQILNRISGRPTLSAQDILGAVTAAVKSLGQSQQEPQPQPPPQPEPQPQPQPGTSPGYSWLPDVPLSPGLSKLRSKPLPSGNDPYGWMGFFGPEYSFEMLRLLPRLGLNPMSGDDWARAYRWVTGQEVPPEHVRDTVRQFIMMEGLARNFGYTKTGTADGELNPNWFTVFEEVGRMTGIIPMPVWQFILGGSGGRGGQIRM